MDIPHASASVDHQALRMEKLMQPLKLKLLTAVLAAASISPVCASSRSFVDRSEKLTVGGVPIGARFNSLPKPLKKLDNCVEDFKRPHFDCEYVGQNGVHYTMINTSLLGVSIPDAQSYKGALPASIHRGDSKSVVRKKLTAITSCRSCWNIVDYNNFGGESVVSGGFFKSKFGTEFSMYFDFDGTGKLVHIKVFSPTD